jgi:hypothetical protein
MNESAYTLFMQGFKRGIWLSVAAPVAVVAAVVQTLITLGFTDDSPFATPSKKSQS